MLSEKDLFRLQRYACNNELVVHSATLQKARFICNEYLCLKYGKVCRQISPTSKKIVENCRFCR